MGFSSKEASVGYWLALPKQGILWGMVFGKPCAWAALLNKWVHRYLHVLLLWLINLITLFIVAAHLHFFLKNSFFSSFFVCMMHKEGKASGFMEANNCITDYYMVKNGLTWF